MSDLPKWPEEGEEDCLAFIGQRWVTSTALVACQGCGAVRDGSWLGKGHACWRNEDGTYEEGGTFQ